MQDKIKINKFLKNNIGEYIVIKNLINEQEEIILLDNFVVENNKIKLFSDKRNYNFEVLEEGFSDNKVFDLGLVIITRGLGGLEGFLIEQF